MKIPANSLIIKERTKNGKRERFGECGKCKKEFWYERFGWMAYDDWELLCGECENNIK